MKMKLFHAKSIPDLTKLEADVNQFLGTLAPQTRVFAVNTAVGENAGSPTAVITVWWND